MGGVGGVGGVERVLLRFPNVFWLSFWTRGELEVGGELGEDDEKCGMWNVDWWDDLIRDISSVSGETSETRRDVPSLPPSSSRAQRAVCHAPWIGHEAENRVLLVWIS